MDFAYTRIAVFMRRWFTRLLSAGGEECLQLLLRSSGLVISGRVRGSWWSRVFPNTTYGREEDLPSA